MSRLRRLIDAPGDESGFSLLELLIALVIIGIVFVGIYGALTETIQSTGVQRRAATGEAYLRQLVESIQLQNATPNAKTCPGIADIAPTDWPSPTDTNFIAPPMPNPTSSTETWSVGSTVVGQITIDYMLPSGWSDSQPSAGPWSFSSPLQADALQSDCQDFYANFSSAGICGGTTGITCLQSIQRVTVMITSSDPDYKQWSGTTQIELRQG